MGIILVLVGALGLAMFTVLAILLWPAKTSVEEGGKGAEGRGSEEKDEVRFADLHLGPLDDSTAEQKQLVIDPLTGFDLDDRRQAVFALAVPMVERTEQLRVDGSVETPARYNEMWLGLHVNQSTYEVLNTHGLIGFRVALRELKELDAFCVIREHDNDVEVPARHVYDLLFGGADDFDTRLRNLDLRVQDDIAARQPVEIEKAAEASATDHEFVDDVPTDPGLGQVPPVEDAVGSDTLRNLEAPVESDTLVGGLDVQPAGSGLMPVPEPELGAGTHLRQGFGGQGWELGAEPESEPVQVTQTPVEAEPVPELGVDAPVDPLRVEAEVLYDLIVHANTPPTAKLLAHARELAAKGIEPLATLASAGGLKTEEAAPEARLPDMAARVDAMLENLGDPAVTVVGLEDDDLSWKGTTPCPQPYVEAAEEPVADTAETLVEAAVQPELPAPPAGFDPANIRPVEG